MIELFVDGDACPVKDEAYLVASRYAVPVSVVANSRMYVPHDLGVPGFWLAGDTTWPGLGTVAALMRPVPTTLAAMMPIAAAATLRAWERGSQQD